MTPSSTSQVISGSTTTAPSTSSTQYTFLMATGATWSSTESGRNIPISSAGTFSRLYINLGTAPTPGQYVFSLYKNGSASAVTITISGSSTTGQDTTNSVHLNVGDTFSIGSVPSSSPAGTGNITWSILFNPDTVGECIVAAGENGTISNSAVTYGPMVGGNAGVIWNSTAMNVQSICPTTGTFTKYALTTTNAPSGSASYTFALVVNGSSTVLATITGSTTSSNGSVSIAAIPGNTLYTSATPSGTPIQAIPRVCLTFVSNVYGESIMLSGDATSTSTSSTEYGYSLGQPNYSTTETNNQIVMLACTLYKLYVQTASAPVTTISFHNRINAANGTLVAVVSGTNTTGFDTTHSDSITLGQLVDIAAIPTSSPTGSVTSFGMVSYIAPTYSSASVSTYLMMGV